MARIRTIKPEFWTSEQVMECSILTRLLFIGMWNFADDHGRMVFAPRTIKAQVFPSDDISVDEIKYRLNELSAKGLILIYSSDGKDFIHITGWYKHQKIDKPKKSTLPDPFVSQPNPRPVVEASSNDPRRVGVGREGKGEEDSEANASGAAAPGEPVYTDSRHELWGEGVPILRQLGVKDREARSNVGRWLKAAGDDAAAVLGAIQRARDHRVIDPIPWVTRAISAPPKLEVINGRQQRPDYRNLAESIIKRTHAAQAEQERASGGLLAHGGGVSGVVSERGSG